METQYPLKYPGPRDILMHNGPMQRRRAAFVACVLIGLLVAALHGMAQYYSLYWYLGWFDIPVHFLGGVLMGSAALWVTTFETTRLRDRRLWLALAFTFAVGALWEVFEYVTGTSAALHYWSDTLLDLCMDLLGALVACAVFSRYVR